MIADFVAAQNANGMPDIRLVDRAEALEIVPGLNDRVVAGSYSPEDGHANPPRTTQAVAAAAQRHGAQYRMQTQVVALLQDGERVIGVRTADGEEIHAAETVLAAGAWSDAIARTIGLRIPVHAYALQMLLSTPAEAHVLKPVIGSIGRQLSLKQLPTGEFFLGGGWLGTPSADLSGYTMRDEARDGNWAAATGLLPAVGRQTVGQRWCGLEAESIDGVPFIGRVPGIESLTIAVGFSGHGFAISPAVGRAVADLVAGQRVPELDGLSPARISQWSAAEIEHYVTTPTREHALAG